jgi:hypothetical protein
MVQARVEGRVAGELLKRDDRRSTGFPAARPGSTSRAARHLNLTIDGIRTLKQHSDTAHDLVLLERNQ